MASYCWRIVALINTGEIAKGMEVEVVTKSTIDTPTRDQIKDAFETKFNIEAPNDIYRNRDLFKIIRPLRQPSFFYDNSTGNPAEVLIDYYMSWTLRCALEEVQENISLDVQQYAKRILYFFLEDALGGVEIDEFKVLEVESLKQWKKIDMYSVIKVDIKDQGIKWFVLTFENKMYTKLHGSQLRLYKEAIDKRYFEKSVEKKIEKLFIYITNHMVVPPEDIKQCGKEFRPLSLWEIVEYLKSYHPDRSGNALFDEFWYNFI